MLLVLRTRFTQIINLKNMYEKGLITNFFKKYI